MHCTATSAQGLAVHRQATALPVCGKSPVAQRLAAQVPVPCLSALPPLLGRLVASALCVLTVSVGVSSLLPGFCFNLSVAEMQSTQRAYFYQRFPILHLEPGDWPPGVASLVCGASRPVRQTLLLGFPYRGPFLPDRAPALVCPRLVGHSSPPDLLQALGGKPAKSGDFTL